MILVGKSIGKNWNIIKKEFGWAPLGNLKIMVKIKVKIDGNLFIFKLNRII